MPSSPSPPGRTVTAWALTTGEAGMRAQARGLAEAVADVVVEKTAPKGWPWPAATGARAALGPPWPDVLITCGRRSAPLSVTLRKASGGGVLTIHVQDPLTDPAQFDLVVAMEHDRIATGRQVIKVATALHDLTPAKLAAAGGAWRDRFAALGRPLAGVLVGGTTRRDIFTREKGRRLIEALQRLRAEAGASLAITASRRTSPAIRRLLREAFGTDPRVFLWDMAGENPYLAILALADRLVVTGDSVSMISEALSTGRPVEIFDLGFAHHAPFLDRLEMRGLARRFVGEPAPPAAQPPVNATLEAATAVRRLLQARTGWSG
ncbi:MAG: mitochondrial fission ELM1 family protein [Caulobacteraceae bacterium]